VNLWGLCEPGIYIFVVIGTAFYSVRTTDLGRLSRHFNRRVLDWRQTAATVVQSAECLVRWNLLLIPSCSHWHILLLLWHWWLLLLL
jgi:hypothetical protein